MQERGEVRPCELLGQVVFAWVAWRCSLMSSSDAMQRVAVLPVLPLPRGLVSPALTGLSWDEVLLLQSPGWDVVVRTQPHARWRIPRCWPHLPSVGAVVVPVPKESCLGSSDPHSLCFPEALGFVGSNAFVTSKWLIHLFPRGVHVNALVQLLSWVRVLFCERTPRPMGQKS